MSKEKGADPVKSIYTEGVEKKVLEIIPLPEGLIV